MNLEEKDPVEKLLTALRDSVFSRIGRSYPNIGARGSFEKGAKSEDKAASRREVSREWVAFSFQGYDFWDFHLGTVLDKEQNTVLIGIHISKKLWPTLRERIEGIPWEKYPPLNPGYRFKEEWGEHRFVEPEIPFESSQSKRILEDLVTKATLYYEVTSQTLNERTEEGHQ